MMEKKVNQRGTISDKKRHFKRAFCRIIGEPRIRGIAFGFLRCRGVFGSLSHFRQSSGAVPPWAPYRWAHVWRNEPRAIILSFSFFPPPSLRVCRLLLAFCLPPPSSLPSFSSLSLHLLYLSLSPPLPFMHLFPLSSFFALPSLPPSVISPLSPRGDCVLGAAESCVCAAAVGGLGGRPRLKRAHRDAGAHLRLVLPENLPVHAPTRSQTR